MKREIKFRAFNIENKQMFLSPSEITHLGSWFDSHLPGSLANSSNIVLMQFIGSKDNTGTDIYEGDIIEIESFYDEAIKYRYQICFKQETCSFVGVGFPGEYLTSDELEGCIVIGNIYENPDIFKS